MSFSAFHRFGNIEFSGRVPDSKKIYESLKRAMGPSFSEEFNGSHTQAKFFAQAMALGSTISILKRLKNNAIGKKATDLLSNQETFYGLTPGIESTLQERRLALHARMLIEGGGRYESVWNILTTLLGSEFEEWIVPTAATLVRWPDTSAEAKLEGNDVTAGTRARVLRTLESIHGSTVTVAVEELTATSSDLASPPLVGTPFLADPVSIGRRERCQVEAFEVDSLGLITSITGTFLKTHDIGILFTTQKFPVWKSNAQSHYFQLSESAASDPETRRQVGTELSRTLKSVATFSMGRPGPFRVGTGLIGITNIGNA